MTNNPNHSKKKSSQNKTAVAATPVTTATAKATAKATATATAKTTMKPQDAKKTKSKSFGRNKTTAVVETKSSSSFKRNGNTICIHHVLATLISLLLGILSPPFVHYIRFQQGWITISRTTSKTKSHGSTTARVLSNNNNNYHHDDPIIVLPPRNCNHDSDEMRMFLGDDPVPGQHVLCWSSSSNKMNNIVLYRNSNANYGTALFSTSTTTTTTTTTPTTTPDLTSWIQFKIVLEQTLNLPRRRYPVQAWAIFNQYGERIVDENYNANNKNEDSNDALILQAMKASGIVLLYEGGQWIWPGIAKGFVRHISLEYSYVQGNHGDDNNNSNNNAGSVVSERRNATLETLSLYPLVFAVHGFLSEEECNYIQTEATPNMKYSGVTLMDKDKGRPASDFRTSQTAFLGGTKYYHQKGSSSPTSLLEQIDLRTSSLVRIPRSHQEYVQVLRYGETEKYDAHCDYFDPQHYQNDPQTMALIEHGKKNRLATVFWYLSNVEEGGETIFPRFNKGPHPHDMKDCSVGLKVKPQRGKVIIFYSLTPEGGMDEYSLHGACPVKQGIKWAANKWVWNKPTGYYRN